MLTGALWPSTPPSHHASSLAGLSDGFSKEDHSGTPGVYEVDIAGCDVTYCFNCHAYILPQNSFANYRFSA